MFLPIIPNTRLFFDAMTRRLRNVSVEADLCCDSWEFSRRLRFENTIVLVKPANPSALAPNSHGGLRCERPTATSLQQRSREHLYRKAKRQIPQFPSSPSQVQECTYQRRMEQLARRRPPLLQLPSCIFEHSSACLQHGQQWSVEEASCRGNCAVGGVWSRRGRKSVQKFKFGSISMQQSGRARRSGALPRNSSAAEVTNAKLQPHQQLSLSRKVYVLEPVILMSPVTIEIFSANLH